jgi:hypothetical protein
MVEEVERWTAAHRQLKRLMKETSELGEQMIRIFVRASRGVARNRKRVASMPPYSGPSTLVVERA